MSPYKREERELLPNPYATIGTKGRFQNRKGPDDFREDLVSQLESTPQLEDAEARHTPFIYKILYEFWEDMKKTETYNETTPKELIVFDFIAGMTDSFAIRSFQELFVPQALV